MYVYVFNIANLTARCERCRARTTRTVEHVPAHSPADEILLSIANLTARRERCRARTVRTVEHVSLPTCMFTCSTLRTSQPVANAVAHGPLARLSTYLPTPPRMRYFSALRTSQPAANAVAHGPSAPLNTSLFQHVSLRV